MRTFLLCLVLLTFYKNSNSQSALNIGFETGTFAGWVGATGQCCPVYTPYSGIDSLHHLITSGNLFDPYSNNLITVTAPGSNYSARLGNENNAAESEVLEYSFVVPGDSLLLLIKYAVVLEDGLHPAVKQPRFSYKINTSSAAIEGCLEREIIAGSNSPGMVKVGNYDILPWQTDIVNLHGSTGELITLHFETGDCGPGGHFGYAYIDCELIPNAIQNSGCNNDGSIILTAHPGLSGMWFDGSTGDSVLIAVPSALTDYFFELNKNTPCEFRLHNNVTSLLPFVEFSTATLCGETTSFYNHSTYTSGSLFSWIFGDGSSSNDFEPQNFYQNSGIYQAQLTVIQTNGCRSTFSDDVLIPEPFNVNIDVEKVCAGEELNLVFTTTPSSSITVYATWKINGSWISDQNILTYTFNHPGQFQIELLIDDGNGCSATTSQIITVDEICNEDLPFPFLPSAFTPNSDGINDFFEMTNLPGFANSSFSIFNRFGQIIFHGSKWDGTYQGAVCKEGVYAYTLTYEFSGKPYSTNGIIALIR